MATNPGTKRPRSSSLFERAQSLFPGGVNSPVRAFKAVGGTPVFIDRGVGAYVFDVDGNRYLDFVGSWGPLILGHANPDVVVAIIHAAAVGDDVRRADRARGRVRRAGALHDAVDGEDAPRLLGHRGDDVGAARGARLHGPPPHHQDRRRLPRPRRHAAGQGRLGRGDAGAAGLGRRAAGGRRRHGRRPVQRSRRHARRVRGEPRRDRRADRRADPRQHGRRAAAARLPAAAAQPVRRARRAADLRRGDHRLPRRARRRAGAVRRAPRSDTPGQDRRRRPAARHLRRPRRRHGRGRAASAPSTRRARCRGTRWRWRPAWRRSSASTSTPT